MKQTLLALGLVACASESSSGGADAGSGSSNPPVRDPSFETAAPNPVGQATGSPWNLATGCSGRFGTVYPSFATGTGFLPSAGTQYARFLDKGCDAAADRTLAIDQYNENLGGKTTLTFDYEMKATVPATCQGATAVVQILFTGNGTQTLWTSPTFGVAGDAQKRDEVVTLPAGLPSLPDGAVCTGACNKLTIRMTTNGGCVPGSINVCPCAEFDFGIDNLRVSGP